MSVPLPAEATDAALVEWATALLAALFPAPVVVEAGE
jgi:hypothetical protein